MEPLSDQLESERNYNDKKVKIVEELVGNKIDVQYAKNSQSNCAYKTKGKYHIVLNGDISIRTGIDHELSHVREGSLEDTFWKPFKAIVKDWTDKNIKPMYEGKEYNFYTAEQLVTDLCHQSMNIIEDIRIESIDGYRYEGRKISYDQLCRGAGKEWTNTTIEENKYIPNNIPSYVLAKRFFREDMIPKEHIKEVNEIYQMSKLTSVLGIQKIFMDWLNGSLGEYIKSQVKSMLDKQDNRDNKRRDRLEKTEAKRDKERAFSRGLRERSDKEENGEDITDIEEEIKKLKEELSLAEDEYEKAEKEFIKAGQELHDETNKKISNQPTVGDPLDMKDPTIKQIETVLKRLGKANLSKEHAKVKSKLDEEKMSISGGHAPELMDNYEPLCPNTYSCDIPNVHDDIVQEIKKIVNTLKQKTRVKLSDEGYDIDVETMLEAVKKGSNEFYLSDEKVNGTSILIAVDCSGSMRDDNRLNTSRDLCATMFRATASLPNIDLKVVCYGGADFKGGKTGVKEINSEAECSGIGIDNNHILTPTAEALIYCAKVIGKMKGKKKLMIFLTDGVPQNYDSTHYTILAPQAGKVYKRIKSQVPNMIIKPVMIDSNSQYDGIIRTIFGKDAMFLKSTQLKEFIRREFKQAVVKSL